MPNPVSTFPSEDLGAFALLYASTINYLLDEAEHYVEHDAAAGLQAISLALSHPLNSFNSLAKVMTGPHIRMNPAALKAARREVRSQQNAINRRIKTLGIDAHTGRDGGNLTEDEEQSINQMASTLGLVAANAAEKALSEKVADQSLALQRRWGYLLAAHRATNIARNSVPDPSKTKAIQGKAPQGHQTTWNRLLGQILGIAADKDEEPNYRSSFDSLCADSGVRHAGNGCQQYPGAVRYIIENLEPDAEWKPSSWLYEHQWETTQPEGDNTPADDPARMLMNLAVFKHRDERHIKLIDEPYPEGYPSNLVKKQMVDLVKPLWETSDDDEAPYRHELDTANAMYEAAAREIHTMGRDAMTDFMHQMRRTLDDPAVADYLFRSLTGHHRGLAALLAPHDVEPPPLVTAEQAAAMLNAARATGVDDARLWELAQLLGTKPKDHGIPTLGINMTAFECLEDAPDDWGIPAMALDRWIRLLDVTEDEHDDYGENE